MDSKNKSKRPPSKPLAFQSLEKTAVDGKRNDSIHADCVSKTLTVLEGAKKVFPQVGTKIDDRMPEKVLSTIRKPKSGKKKKNLTDRKEQTQRPSWNSSTKIQRDRYFRARFRSENTSRKTIPKDPKKTNLAKRDVVGQTPAKKDAVDLIPANKNVVDQTPANKDAVTKEN